MKEIKFAGFGGQGIILAGYITGKAASLYDRQNAVHTQSYGPEARGGACSTDVIVSKEEIDYPVVHNPDILVLMSQGAYNKFSCRLKEGGTMIIDEDLVFPEHNNGFKLYKVPATRIAEELKGKIIANIVMLGAFTSITKAIGRDAMERAIVSSVPKGTEELNTRAFLKGFEYGKKCI